ncbi:dihydrofolate reductase [Hymenobacter sp. DH14]|uniref:Dihydrofolate reductase n=1 Tax=Hymenobacter cyanobacteriorum TaxID=2926463 RepID=A0A9X1VDM1_9BACT|nr:dihydrofolate reductase [Hymenobacter cyanobacteriorum]MCI1186182.1 dihydrofolate reductase [Hymenobacter cyanobacteriorum]
MVALVVAVAENGIIGQQGQLPWGRMPADLRHFKQLTLGHPVVMGRKTFDSIGKALPGRPNVVVTRQAGWAAPGCEVAGSVLGALERARELDAETVCVIGGGEIYREALPTADVVYLTEIHHTFEGDASFPPLSPSEWREETRERHEADAQHTYAYSFVTLRRR